ncbi:MAG: ribonuclease HII [Pseudomonadota bacterium]
MPDFALESAAGGLVAGIDEAGRGPLAGPVVAAAVILAPPLPAELAARIDDSKKMTRAAREAAFAELWARRRAGAIAIGVGAASAGEVDRLDILRATFLAMRRALRRLRLAPQLALVDGNRAPPELGCRVETLVGGDAKSLSVAAASIVAKVIRDRAMTKLARRYPGYGWATNMGYGTPEHIAGLARLGATPHHRLSFAPVAQGRLGPPAPVRLRP